MPGDPLPSATSLVPSDAWALFLDVDGTLLAIAETPDAVVVSERLRDVLQRLPQRLGGAVALISGRSIADLDRLFAPATLPAAGQHGLERRDAAGHCQSLVDGAILDAFRDPLQGLAESHPGVIIEDKGFSIAVHYRRAPQAQGAIRTLLDRLLAEADEDLRVIPGKMVYEVKVLTSDKGKAILSFLDEPPFAGRRAVFLGDDVTDEDGFAAVNAIGGLSIRVGDAPQTAARYRLDDNAAVIDWLASLDERLAAGAAGPDP